MNNRPSISAAVIPTLALVAMCGCSQRTESSVLPPDLKQLQVSVAPLELKLSMPKIALAPITVGRDRGKPGLEVGKTIVLEAPAVSQSYAGGESMHEDGALWQFKTASYHHICQFYLQRGLLERGLTVKVAQPIKPAKVALVWGGLTVELPVGSDIDLASRPELADFASLLAKTAERKSTPPAPQLVVKVEGSSPAVDSQPDYILAIGRISIERDEAVINLKNDPAASAFAKSNNLTFGSGEGQLPIEITKPGFRAVLTGQLTDGQTGQLRWVGHYTVSSDNLQESNIGLTVNRTLSPGALAQQSDVNKRLQAAYGELNQAREALNSATDKVAAKSTYTTAERKYQDLCVKADELETTLKNDTVYRISQAEIKPELDLEHRKKLLSTLADITTNSLMGPQGKP